MVLSRGLLQIDCDCHQLQSFENNHDWISAEGLQPWVYLPLRLQCSHFESNLAIYCNLKLSTVVFLPCLGKYLNCKHTVSDTTKERYVILFRHFCHIPAGQAMNLNVSGQFVKTCWLSPTIETVKFRLILVLNLHQKIVN